MDEEYMDRVHTMITEGCSVNDLAEYLHDILNIDYEKAFLLAENYMGLDTELPEN
jgi:hypothetical protein